MNDSSDYRLVFDLASQGYTAWHFVLPIAGAALAMSIVRTLARDGTTSEEQRGVRWYRFVATAGSIIMSLAAIMLFIATWTEYRTLRRTVADGKVRTVVGTVSDFAPEGPGGHPHEHLRVGDVVYDYSTYSITPGFRQTVPEGGPLRSGARVRIADVDGIIVRLEVAR